ncbi:MAG TPA: hypothetical protein VLK65_23090 [Vicinamibacteria bacterium]|nr:hypothetical protein [Vicinamibacteria bacterium]
MKSLPPFFTTLMAGLLLEDPASAQQSLGQQMELLEAQRDAVESSNAHQRIPAMYVIKELALSSDFVPVKSKALELLQEPVGSSTDQIRLPAIYAIAELANSTDDHAVKLKAIESLTEPFHSEQLVARDVAIDAMNLIVGRIDKMDPSSENLIVAALNLLIRAADSGNNGARMPAINAVWCTVSGSNFDRAYSVALDVLAKPISSRALIGGMEVRFMAIEAIERVGIEAKPHEIKEKAIRLLSDVPDTDKERARQATTRIYETMG